ncbi:MAG TPA: hypothetical protein VMK12_17295 [Anaeromyxobacteraceae bacterium]|nr:hypothetical protein [Anaeromyxobacteraceae bacterium]
MTRWHGLKDLLVDAVHHGSIAVEEVHQAVARRPIEILQRVPPLASTARFVGAWQSAGISAVYGAVRVVNAAAGQVAGAIIDLSTRGKPVQAGKPCGPPGDAAAAREIAKTET